MSIFARLAGAGRGDGMEQRSLMSSAFIPPPQVGVIDDFVGVHRAMAHMTVFACVRLLADTIASLPWKVYRRDANGMPKEVKPQPALVRQPWPGFDLFQWKWMCVASMALRGNSYHMVTSRDKSGNPTALLPLHPDIVFLERQPDILEWFAPIYRVMGEAIPRTDMVHMRRFTMPGEPWGLSPVRQAAVAIGMGLSAEEYGYRYFKESANPSGTLSTDLPLDDEAIKRVMQNWIQSQGGRRLPAVLTGGFKWQTLSISPDEAQFLECVVPGTLVSMADGTRKPVDKLTVGEQVMAWDGSKLVAAPVKAVGKPPIKQLVRVTTARGRELTCSIDHPILGLKRLRTPGGRPLPVNSEWIPAGDLKVGQYVRAALGALPTAAEPLSEDVSYFLGAMVGDGYIRTGCCAFSSGNDAVTDRMRVAVEHLGGTLHYKDRYDYEIHTGGSGRGGSPIRGLLNESGLVGRHSHDKFVPDMIMRGGVDTWRTFLSAYFDADGSIRDRAATQKPAAYWSSTSFELLNDCQHLLALLGINSAIYPMGDAWGLYVMGLSEMRKLADTLILAHNEKRRRLADYRDAAPTRYRSVNFEYDAVKTVEYLGPGQTVGVEVEGLHTHVTAGLITHNTRQFQRSEICLMFGVPPILIGDTKETTAWGTGVEQITLGAVTYTFRPWTSCIESVINNCLPNGQFVKFDYSALLRGDFAGQLNALKTAVQGSQMTPNETRATMEMDPVEGGDQLLVPPGYMTASAVASLRPTPPSAAPQDKPGTLPMPPTSGGENNPSASNRGGDTADSSGNGHQTQIDTFFGDIEQEMRGASRSHGKPNDMLSGDGRI